MGDESENWRAAPAPDSVRAIVEDLVAQATGGRVLHRFWFVPGLQVWEVEHTAEAWACEQASELPWTKYAVRPRAGELAQPIYPSDPAYQAGYQYGLDRICMPHAWNIIKDCSAYPIAVTDSGIDYSNPQLAPRIAVNTNEPLPPDGIDNDANGYTDDHWGVNVSMRDVDCPVAVSCSQTCEGDPAIGADGGTAHGSHVAEVCAAVTDDCRSIAGVGYYAKIVPIKITQNTDAFCNYTIGFFTTTEVALAFEYALERGAKIINCSWTASTFDDPALYESFKALDENNVVAVLAAGNFNFDIDGTAPPGLNTYPALYTFDNFLVVGASDQADDPWRAGPPSNFGSNWGANSVDLFAPGVLIRTSTSDPLSSCTATASGFFQTGTSFAAPHVAGVAALVWARNPLFTASDVVEQIRGTSRATSSLNGLCVSGGVLDASAAVGGVPCNP